MKTNKRVQVKAHGKLPYRVKTASGKTVCYADYKEAVKACTYQGR